MITLFVDHDTFATHQDLVQQINQFTSEREDRARIIATIHQHFSTLALTMISGGEIYPSVIDSHKYDPAPELIVFVKSMERKLTTYGVNARWNILAGILDKLTEELRLYGLTLAT